MSEVSQLFEMNAGLSSSKELNHRWRQEAGEASRKIADLEARLEEKVSVTHRHLENKQKATTALEKRVQAEQDLALKADHVVKRSDQVHQARLKQAQNGVQEHQEGIGAKVVVDLGVSLERLSRAASRNTESSKQQALTKNLPSENRAKEDEAKELANRAEEVEAQTEEQRKCRAAKDAARSSLTQVAQHKRNERSALETRVENAASAHEQTCRETTKLQAEVEAAERSDNEQAMLDTAQKNAACSDLRALERNLIELSVDKTGRQEKVEAEQEESAKMMQELALEAENVRQESRQEDSKVVAMRDELQKKRQRRDILGGQLKAAEHDLAAHAINEPEFGDRKAEHQALTSKIASIRTTQASNGARRAAHEEEIRRVTQETAAAKTALDEDIRAQEKENGLVLSKRKEMAGIVATKDALVAKVQADRASIEAEQGDVTANLDRLLGLEEEQTRQAHMAKEDPEHARAVAEDHAAALELQEEEERIKQATESLQEELQRKAARDEERRLKRLEADKQQLLTAAVTQKAHDRTQAIEASRHEEVQTHEKKIMAADEKYRAACAAASQIPSVGGAEERLLEELATIQAQVAAEEPKVKSAESRVERLSARAQPRSSRGGVRSLATAMPTSAGETVDGEDGEKGEKGGHRSGAIGDQDAAASAHVDGEVEIQPLLRRHMENLESADRKKSKTRQHVNPLAATFQTPVVLPERWFPSAFRNPSAPLLVDIGCAKGSFVRVMAMEKPEWNYLGLEIRRPTAAVALERVAALGTRNCHVVCCNANVDLDTVLTEAAHHGASIDTICIQFPDPHFKARHYKRRVVQPELVTCIEKHLRPGGTLFMQSDVLDVVEDMRIITRETAQVLEDARPDMKDWMEGRDSNPFGVQTERETATYAKESPEENRVFRCVFVKKTA
eukprot:g14581.t1